MAETRQEGGPRGHGMADPGTAAASRAQELWRWQRRLLVGLAFPGFVGIGLHDGLLGVAWPSIRAAFGLQLDALGPWLAAITAGAVLSSFLTGRLLGHLGVGRLLALAAGVLAASLLGYGAATRFGVLVALGAGAGLGAGAIDAGLNIHVASHHSPRAVNWLHACYGVGAAAGPVLMTSLLAAGLSWRAGYRTVGAGLLILAAGFAATHRRWSAKAAGSGEGGAGRHDGSAARGTPLRATLALVPARLGMTAFFLYTGLEASTGAWAFSLLTEGRGLPAASAGRAVSLFWAGLTVGRIGFGWIAHRAPIARLLRITIVGMALAAGLVALDAGPVATFAGLIGLGLACGPVFPCLIAATPARLGPRHVANAVGFQVAAAAVGQSVLPALAGVAAQHLGLEAVPAALVAGALALFGVHEVLDARFPAAGAEAPGT
jgi:fucose permease